jgi:hypothetical protein
MNLYAKFHWAVLSSLLFYVEWRGEEPKLNCLLALEPEPKLRIAAQAPASALCKKNYWLPVIKSKKVNVKVSYNNLFGAGSGAGAGAAIRSRSQKKYFRVMR